MTQEEMQRLLDEFAQDGFGEYEALRRFARVLGVRYPVEKEPRKEPDAEKAEDKR